MSDAAVKGVGGIAATSQLQNEHMVRVSLQSHWDTLSLELQLSSSTYREAVGVPFLFRTLTQRCCRSLSGQVCWSTEQ